MRIKTELSERPSAYTVVREGDEAAVIFYTDVEEVQRDGETVYTAVTYDLRRPWADNLETRIAAHPEDWLAFAAAEADRQAAEEEVGRIQAQLEAALPDTLLDLDFRLMMLEFMNM